MSLSSLTAQERRVLMLVSGHLTNRQIADELVIAESTVESHGHRILRKLGVATRRDAARLLLRAVMDRTERPRVGLRF